MHADIQELRIVSFFCFVFLFFFVVAFFFLGCIWLWNALSNLDHNPLTCFVFLQNSADMETG